MHYSAATWLFVVAIIVFILALLMGALFGMPITVGYGTMAALILLIAIFVFAAS